MNSPLLTQKLSEVIPPLEFYIGAFPLLVTLVGALTVLMVGVFRARPSQPHLPSFGVAIVTLVTAFGAAVANLGNGSRSFISGAFLADSLSQFAMATIALVGLFSFLISSISSVGRNLLRFELVTLQLFAISGLMVMTSAGEFLSFFIGLEMTSLSLYVLVGYQREDAKGFEAAMKYFLLGSVASAILLMGQALVYLHTGSMAFSSYSSLSLSSASPLAFAGMLLLVVGLGFKMAMAPFHGWAPDVYQGAHASLSGFMSGVVKLALVVVCIRVFGAGAKVPSAALVTGIWIMGALSIFLGSLFGLVHNNVKRMLAYSSIANAGYFCLPLLALMVNPNNSYAKPALLAYAVIYALLTLGAFGVISWLEEGNREDLLKDELAGLGQKNPFAAVVLSVFLVGLAGVPPLAGFFGKFLILQAASSEGFVGLSVLMVILSCVSLYFYLSLLVEMWFKGYHKYSIKTPEIPTLGLAKWVFGALALLVLFFGVAGPRFLKYVNFEESQKNQLSSASKNTLVGKSP
jgi:NADH-quinone oxidoreductase subunit N